MVCPAHALAIIVFPVPGGPNIKQPFGGLIPMFSNFSLWVIGKTMASLNYSICLSSPPMSVYSYDGLSSTYIDLTLESYSAGSFSSKMYESLLTPTSSPGLSNELSTRPGIGKKTVFLVLVLTTTHFSSGFSSGSTSSSSSGSISRISTTLLTNQGNCLFCLILFLLSWSSYWTFFMSALILFI